VRNGKQQEWYWNDEENENQDIEIPIVVRLPKHTVHDISSILLSIPVKIAAYLIQRIPKSFTTF
jgi:hypothetical protein